MHSYVSDLLFDVLLTYRVQVPDNASKVSTPKEHIICTAKQLQPFLLPIMLTALMLPQTLLCATFLTQ